MKIGVIVVAVSAAAGAAYAQYSTDFEGPAFSGSAAGVSVTGQNSWYLPAVANSADGLVQTYAGNPLGFPQNPAGGDQFVLTMWENRGGLAFNARAQHPMDFGSADRWTVTYDFACQRLGLRH